MENEVWKDVAGFEGLYQVSNTGLVKSVVRGKHLSSNKEKNGYIKACLYKNGVRYKFWVHRLVALAFIPNTFNKREVNHKDSCGSNNHIDNLEWVTASENMKHLVRAGRSNIKKITHLGSRIRSKPVRQLSLTGEVIATHTSIANAARSIGSGTGDICATLKGKQKTCKGYKWEYAQKVNTNS